LFFAASIVLLAGAWIKFLTSDDDRLFAGLVTATLSAASIVYSLARARQSARSQFTLTLLAGRFSNSDYADNVRIFSDARRLKRVRTDTTLTQLKALRLIDKNDKKVPFHAIVPLLNFWEHVCTAYVDDHIDRQVFEDAVRDMVTDITGYLPTIIGDMRREEPSNFEHLCAVWFILVPDADRERLVPLLGSPPARLAPDDKWRWSMLGQSR